MNTPVSIPFLAGPQTKKKKKAKKRAKKSPSVTPLAIEPSPETFVLLVFFFLRNPLHPGGVRQHNKNGRRRGFRCTYCNALTVIISVWIMTHCNCRSAFDSRIYGFFFFFYRTEFTSSATGRGRSRTTANGQRFIIKIRD